jgi:hypothetical protein
MWEPLPAHFVKQRMQEPKALSPIEIEAFRPHKRRQASLGQCLWFALKFACGLFFLYVTAMHFLGGAL